jgi:hypothetical protein
MMASLRITLTVVLLLAAGLAPAFTADMSLELVASLGGDAVHTIAVQGDLVYCSSKTGLVIYDASDPAHITRIGTADVGSAALSVAVAGNYAYLGMASDELRIFDVSDPTLPVQVGRYSGMGAGQIIIDRGYAYVGGNFSGYYVLDLSDPAYPVEVYHVVSSDYPYVGTMVISGNYAYVPYNSMSFIEVRVRDISDPRAPQDIGAFAIPNGSWPIAASPGRLYLGDTAGGVRIWDVSNPASARELGSIDTGYVPEQAVVSGDYAFVREELPTVEYVWDELPDRDIIHVIDASNPSAVREVGSFAITGRMSYIAHAGAILYAAVCGHGVVAVDTSDPAAPAEAGRALSTSGGYLMVINEQYAYLTGYQCVDVIGVSRPSVPAFVALFPHHEYAPVAADARGYLYCLATYNGQGAGRHGMRILDASDPTHVTTVAELFPDTDFAALAVSGDYAYAAHVGADILVLDISDPQLTHLVGVVGYGSGIQTSGIAAAPNGYVYTSTQPPASGPGSFLNVVDVSTPTAPALAAQLSFPDTWSISDIVLRGQYLYLTTDARSTVPASGRLLIVDVSRPTGPMVAGTVEWTCANADWVNVSGIALVANLAYVRVEPEIISTRPMPSPMAIEVAGPRLAVIDVTNPSAPAEVRSYPLGDSFLEEVAADPAARMTAIGRYLYFTQCGRGLAVFSEGRFPDVPGTYWAFDEIMDCAAAGIVSGYPDGAYRPFLPVTRDQMAVYISRALAGGDASVPAFTGTPSFSDVPTDYWALKYVQYAVSKGVVKGYSDGTYKPTDQVDRGQMSVFIARAIATPTAGADLVNYTPPATATFPDVPTSFWAYKYVEYIAQPTIAVTKGYPDGDYHPEYICTRDQMAVYVARAFKLPV